MDTTLSAAAPTVHAHLANTPLTEQPNYFSERRVIIIDMLYLYHNYYHALGPMLIII